MLPAAKNCSRATQIARKVRAMALMGCGLYGIWTNVIDIPPVRAACNSNIVRATAVLQTLLGCGRRRGSDAAQGMAPATLPRSTREAAPPFGEIRAMAGGTIAG